MARDFSARTDIDNTDPVNFPDGRILDSNPASANNGTAVVEAVLGDTIQFVLKLLRDAGITPNGNADTDSVNQYLDGLIAKIRETSASETERGSIEIATQPETDASTDDVRAVTPLKLEGKFDDKVASQAQADAGTDNQQYITPLLHAQKLSTSRFNVIGSENPNIEFIDIGDWDMDAIEDLAVPHGMGGIGPGRGLCEILIRNDTDANLFPFSRGGTYSIDSTFINLTRTATGFFDNNNFNTASSFNRGYIVLFRT